MGSQYHLNLGEAFRSGTLNEYAGFANATAYLGPGSM